MYFSIASFVSIFLLAAGSVESSAIPHDKRSLMWLGWHSNTPEKISKMQEKNTIVFQGNSKPGKNQLGDGTYLAERLGDYGSSDKMVCLFAVDTTAMTGAEKVNYPEKNRQGKQIQWLFSADDDQRFGKNARAYFKDIGADRHTALRISKWDNGMQLMIPETKTATLGHPERNPLGITVVECAPWSQRHTMQHKDVVVDFRHLPGEIKGWLAGETPTPELCPVAKRDASGKKVKNKSCKKPTNKAPKKPAKGGKKTKGGEKVKGGKHTKPAKHHVKPKKTHVSKGKKSHGGSTGSKGRKGRKHA